MDADGGLTRAGLVEAVAGGASGAAAGLAARRSGRGDVATLEATTVALARDVFAGLVRGAGARGFADARRRTAIAGDSVPIVALLTGFHVAVSADRSTQSTVLDADGGRTGTGLVEAVAARARGAACSLTARWSVRGEISTGKAAAVALARDVFTGLVRGA